MISRLVVLFLAGVSVWYFLTALRRRLHGIRTARPPLPRDGAALRLWRVFAEAVLQTRVIRGRPWAGLLHALVLWGFVAFAWVSFEHFSLGLRGLEHAEQDASWYGTFAAWWAAAVLIGILGLSFRRFVLRPQALGELSVSSAVVAALIVVLMATYLAGWRGLPAGSAAWQVNWWLHTLAFLGMLFVIPNSKHLHLVLAPVAIYFRSETTSGTRPLREEDDDDFGMLSFRHLSAKDILDVNTCVECGRCTEACPANVIGGTLDPKHVILQMQRGWLSGGDIVAGTREQVEEGAAWVTEEDLYQCLSCGACEQACPVGIEHVGAKILDLRRGLVSEGRTHNEKLTTLFTTMERAPHNPWGVAHETRQKLIESGGFPLFDGTQEWLLWLGCGGCYDPHGQQVVRSMKTILEAAGVSWGVLERESCCAEPARRAGNEYLYMELSERVIEAFRSKRVKKLVTCDPHCTRMFDVDYRQNRAYQDLGITVSHHTELIESLISRLPLRGGGAEKVTFHDPCYLARGRGVTEQPRTILKRCGGELVEMSHSRERTFCCGAGGAQLYIADDKTEFPGGRVNHRRFREAAATGASIVAVACPYCPIMLRDAAQAARRDDLQILDVAELVAGRLQPGESRAGQSGKE